MFWLLSRPCAGKDGPGYRQVGKYWHYREAADGRWKPAKVSEKGEHTGRDIVCEVGVQVKAPYTGIVRFEGWQNPKDHKEGLGLRVIIESETKHIAYDGEYLKPYISVAHLSEIFVVEGGRVVEGQTVLGLSGETGNATGPHVHVHVTDPRFGHPIQPIEFDWR